jgi:hypothetical protein
MSRPEADLVGDADPDDDVETVDALPVLAEPAPSRSLVPADTVARQAVVVAATGFVAGAAVAVLARRRGRRAAAGPRLSLSNGRRRRKPRKGELRVAASRSFLVDVHLVDRG